MVVVIVHALSVGKNCESVRQASYDLVTSQLNFGRFCVCIDNDIPEMISQGCYFDKCLFSQCL